MFRRLPPTHAAPSTTGRIRLSPGGRGRRPRRGLATAVVGGNPDAARPAPPPPGPAPARPRRRHDSPRLRRRRPSTAAATSGGTDRPAQRWTAGSPTHAAHTAPHRRRTTHTRPPLLRVAPFGRTYATALSHPRGPREHPTPALEHAPATPPAPHAPTSPIRREHRNGGVSRPGPPKPARSPLRRHRPQSRPCRAGAGPVRPNLPPRQGPTDHAAFPRANVSVGGVGRAGPVPRRVAYRETPRRARTLYRHSRQAFPPRTAPGRARGSPRGAGRRCPGRGTTAIHASDAAARRGTGATKTTRKTTT